MAKALSDEEAGRQILDIFKFYKTPANGFLRRNCFTSVRDGDFQRGISRAIENEWIVRHIRDRYRYILTERGFAAYRAAIKLEQVASARNSTE